MTATAWRTAADLRSEVADFMVDHPPRRLPHDLEERFQYLVDYQRELHAAGLAVVSWPETMGGRGYGPIEAMEVASALGRAQAPEFINFVAIEVVAPALMAYARADQLERWLPPMANADEVWVQLFSEPDAGSDLAALRTRATFDGSNWRVTGSKVWSTWGQFAHKGLLLARTGPLADRHRSIAAFVIDMQQPGVEIRPLVTMTGAAEFAEVVLTDAIVRSDDVVGDIADGWNVTLRTLESERGPYAIRRAAVLAGGLAGVLDDARSSRLTPALRRQVTDAFVAMRLLEHRTARIAELLAAGLPLGAEATMAKMLLADAEQRIFDAAHALTGLGGIAWTEEPVSVEEYLYSRAASIYGGSAEIQRNILGERHLGLPREPKA